MIRKFLLIIFLCMITNIYPFESNSIIITHIGETDRIWEVIIINAGIEGHLTVIRDGNLTLLNFYSVQNLFFYEIIDLINNNLELFVEKEWNYDLNRFRLPEYGSFEIHINNENNEDFFYLVEREKSILFFSELLELIRSNGHYNNLLSQFEILIRIIE